MLEFILDFLFDLIFEGTIIVMSEKKVPIPIRIIAFILIAVMYIGIGGLCMYASVLAWMDKETIPAILFLGIGLFVWIGGFVQMRKEIRKKNEE